MKTLNSSKTAHHSWWSQLFRPDFGSGKQNQISASFFIENQNRAGKQNSKIDEFHRKSHFWAEKENSGPEKKLKISVQFDPKSTKFGPFLVQNDLKSAFFDQFRPILGQFCRNRRHFIETGGFAARTFRDLELARARASLSQALARAGSLGKLDSSLPSLAQVFSIIKSARSGYLAGLRCAR